MKRRLLSFVFICLVSAAAYHPAMAHPGAAIAVDANGRVYFVDTGVHLRVALRRAEARVPEQLLNAAQIAAALEQVRGKRVPQRVRADAEPRAAHRDVPFAPAGARSAAADGNRIRVSHRGMQS